MAKFDGLVWKKGDDGWKSIPAGIGYVSKDFDPATDEAALRVEDAVKAGYGGKSVDFREINDLLTACPPEGTVTTSSPPKVIYAAVHPTNLKAAIIVWSAPVIMLDPSKISGGNPSLNGRVMTVTCGAVKIDGSDTASISIGAGAVGAYGTIDDPDAASVADTSTAMYAGSQNDTSVGDDRPSQTTGQPIPLFVPCAAENITVSVSFTYKMEDAKQSCGEPHKIWGACYCIWGSTAPMETFPFGTVMDIDPGNLTPDSTFYGGTVSSSVYVDRGSSFKIAIAGVAGPVIEVDSVNDKAVPLQPGQAVSFQNYLCDTVCGVAKMTKMHDVDEALAYVDEDIIKPSERTLPVYTFLETTYYQTTMYGFKTTEIPALTTTELKTELFTSLWQNTVIYDTAVKWSTDLKFPQGDISTITYIRPYTDGTEWKIVTEPTYDFALTSPDVPVLGGRDLAADPALVGLLRDDGVGSAQIVVNPSNVVAHVFPVGAKAVSPAPTGVGIKQFAGAPYTARFLPTPGAAIAAAPEKATLTLTGFNIDQVPAGGSVITGIGTTTLVVCGEGGAQVTLTIVTSIGTASADSIVINALTFANTLDVVTNIATSPANEVVISTLTSLPDVTVITTVPLVDPLTTTAITASTITLMATTALLPQATCHVDLMGVVRNVPVAAVADRAADTMEVFIVTGDTAPPFVDLTKFSALVDLTAFDPNGTALTLMKPVPNSTLTLPMLDTTIKIPILDTTGTNPIALLIKNTDGDLKLIGVEDPLVNNETLRFPKGQCTPGSVDVLSTPSGDYENDGEIKLLSPIPVRKNIGNAEECPCFTVADTDGGPSKPIDNSTLGALKPCTMRVRRLQLRQCHV